MSIVETGHRAGAEGVSVTRGDGHGHRQLVTRYIDGGGCAVVVQSDNSNSRLCSRGSATIGNGQRAVAQACSEVACILAANANARRTGCVALGYRCNALLRSLTSGNHNVNRGNRSPCWC